MRIGQGLGGLKGRVLIYHTCGTSRLLFRSVSRRFADLLRSVDIAAFIENYALSCSPIRILIRIGIEIGTGIGVLGDRTWDRDWDWAGRLVWKWNWSGDCHAVAPRKVIITLAQNRGRSFPPYICICYVIRIYLKRSSRTMA